MELICADFVFIHQQSNTSKKLFQNKEPLLRFVLMEIIYFIHQLFHGESESSNKIQVLTSQF